MLRIIKNADWMRSLVKVYPKISPSTVKYPNNDDGTFVRFGTGLSLYWALMWPSGRAHVSYDILCLYILICFDEKKKHNPPRIWTPRVNEPAAPLSYTARLCTFRMHRIRFYTLSIAHAPFTTRSDCHSSRYYTPRLPTFCLRTFGHPHFRCCTLLFLHKAIVHNAFTTHPDSTQPIHHIAFLHSSFVHVSSVEATHTSILRGQGRTLKQFIHEQWFSRTILHFSQVILGFSKFLGVRREKPKITTLRCASEQLLVKSVATKMWMTECAQTKCGKSGCVVTRRMTIEMCSKRRVRNREGVETDVVDTKCAQSSCVGKRGCRTGQPDFSVSWVGFASSS